MDVMRYVLSILVFSNHFFFLTDSGLIGTIRGGVQPCFFALSGFLAYRSYEKSKGYADYLIKRLARLMPLYLIVVVGFAIGLSLAGTLPLYEYFTDAGFWKYLGANALTLNFLEPALPGVFTGDRFLTSAVNGSLWTMKVELLLTLTYPAVELFFKRFGHNKVLTAVIILSIAYVLVMNHMYQATERILYDIMARQFIGQAYVFYIGMLIYLNLDYFLRHKWQILAAIGVSTLLLVMVLDYNIVVRFASLATTIIWLSVVGDWGKRLSHHDNLSYGIYLCHFPIIQLVVMAGLPAIVPTGLLFILTLAVVVILAAMLVPPANRLSKRLMERIPKKSSVSR